MSARTGDVERLYRQGYPRYVRVATAITREPEAAAEAVQEAFARALRHRRSFRGDAPLEAWLWRVVVNEAKRRAAAPVTVTTAVAEPAANGMPPEQAAVRALIAALPERQRLAVFLRYYADLDYRTIGEALEIETGTVSATLAAAHRSLRESIERVSS